MSSTGKKHQELISQRLSEYFSDMRPGKGGWEGSLESLTSFIFKVVDEDDRDINIKVKHFENSVEELKSRFSSSMTRDQEIHMGIWMGQCFEKFGVWDKALSSYHDAFGHCEDDAYDNLKTEVMRSEGYIYAMRNQWKKALDSFQESLKLCQSAGDQEGEAHTYNGIGMLYFEKGELTDAAIYWEKGLGLAEQINETKMCAQISNNLGALMSTSGDWDRALAYYGKSVTMFEKVGEYRGVAEAHHNMGMTYADMKRWSESADCYEKSYEIAKEIGDVRLQAMVKLNRVEMYATIKDIYFGLALCNQALKTFKELEDHLGEAEAYKFLGMLYTRVKEWDLASSFFEDAIHCAEKYKNPLLAAESHYQYGIMQKAKNNPEMAIMDFKKALSLFKSMKAEKDIERVKEALDSMSP